MSFLSGGPECSTAGNPLSQFSKHVQDDKSLQRDRLVGRGPGGPQETLRSARPGGGADGLMDEFMQQPAQLPPHAVEQMRREFEGLHAGPAAPRQQQARHLNGWAGEFGAGAAPADQARMEAAFQHGWQQQRPGSARAFDHAWPQAQAEAATSAFAQQRRVPPMGTGYGNMMYGGGMGGMGMMYRPQQFAGMASPPPQQEVEVQGKGKGRMVELDDTDWEAQFAQMEADSQEKSAEAEPQVLDRDQEAQDAIERELADLDRRLADDLEFSADQHMGEFAHEEWDNFDSLGNSLDLHTHLRDPAVGDYLFEEDNLFSNVSDPFAEGVRIMDEGGNLSLAALAFEAAAQKDPTHVEAWTRLGAAQAQNEKESPAIRALEQAIKLDPTNLEALMGLAVSYTNEGYDSTAYRTLERWLSTKYPSIHPADALSSAHDDAHASTDPFTGADMTFTDRHILHERVTNLFIRAAQLSPSPEAMDPDVQVGLGVLFYGAEEFDKAVDCFSAALASSESGTTNSRESNQRPLLWNRLGATLANSGRSEEAIQAYERALELNPNFVRARYNLGVSCINIGCYHEAAQHLLGALAMHAVVEKESRERARELVGDGAGDGPGGRGGPSDVELERILRQNQSTNLYDTLRRVFGQMQRRDLADKVVTGVDVDIFRSDFDF